MQCVMTHFSCVIFSRKPVLLQSVAQAHVGFYCSCSLFCDGCSATAVLRQLSCDAATSAAAAAMRRQSQRLRQRRPGGAVPRAVGVVALLGEASLAQVRHEVHVVARVRAAHVAAPVAARTCTKRAAVPLLDLQQRKPEETLAHNDCLKVRDCMHLRYLQTQHAVGDGAVGAAG